MVCLLIFSLDLATKSYLIGWDEFRKNKWLLGYTVVITVSMIDWVLSVSMVCDERLRVRRLFRPFFLLQNSSLMKKTLKCIKRTLPEIASVILLLALHLCLFTMLGMLLFVKTEDPSKNREWESHFRGLPNSLTSLLVLLTTANNPDVMIPAYSMNRAYFIFFMLFSVIGTYCLMNLLTAIIYNQFRGYLLMSVQTSIIRRRLGIRAAFEVLNCRREQPNGEKSHCRIFNEFICKLWCKISIWSITKHPPLPEYHSPVFQTLQRAFSHYALTVIGNAVALANVICICVSSTLTSKSTTERDNFYMEIINLLFILYYLCEMSAKLFAFGWKGYFSYRNNVFDGLLTVLLLCLQISMFVFYKRHDVISLWELVRMINMLIVFRLLRIIPDIKLMALVASTLMDLVKNLRAFAGILVVVYYVFAVIGIWLFEGAIKPPPILSNSTMENITTNFSVICGTYEQLEYWPNNFDDFAAAIILLYDVMIVNNWQAFIEAYSRYTTEWSKIYFVGWWLVSSVMWVNLFVALILENFIYKWDRSHSCSVIDVERIRYETSVQLMFKGQIQEPTEEELLCQLHQHPHLHLDQEPNQSLLAQPRP
uniref:Ion transport domain-containing protein n=1 Tax=Periophthalmus magnuspinnatus TaxID=409849 RepID=A0A3B3ZE98_9GOBI